MMYRIKRRLFTLLELIIAMSLTLLLVSILFYFYQDLSRIGFETNKASDTHFYWQYAGSRLADILPRTVGEKDPEDFLFYSLNDSHLTKPGSQSLVFAFDNQVSLNKLFSNTVVGRLFVDNKDQLTLAYWPPASRWKDPELPPMKKEILKQNVQSISFAFFVPPEKSKLQNPTSSKSDAQPPASGTWITTPWLREYGMLPAMVRMIVIPKKVAKKEQEPSIIYVFPLPNSGYRIVYEP